MVSVKHVVLSTKIMWFKRFGNSIPAKWKVLAQELMGIKKINIFKQQSIQNVEHHIKSKFYYNLLSIWFNFLIPNITSVHDLLKEKLFDNPLIMVDKKPIMIEHKDWCSSGFSLVSDILNKDLKTFKTKICLQQEYKIKISDMKYNQIVSAVTDKLHKVSKIKRKSYYSQGANIPMQCLVDISKIKNCQVYKHYITTTYSIPTQMCYVFCLT